MKIILSIGAALAIGVALAAQPSPGAAPADLLVLNGKVYTAGKNATFAQAVAVRGNKIAAVGTAQEIEKLRGPDTQVVDAGGGAVLPGFNDVHTHMLSGGLAMDTVDLGGAGTLEEVQQRIRTFAAAHADRQWIQGRGWHYEPFPGGQPTRAQLDAVVAGSPGGDALLRRPQRLGELEGAGARRDHQGQHPTRQTARSFAIRKPASRPACSRSRPRPRW